MPDIVTAPLTSGGRPIYESDFSVFSARLGSVDPTNRWIDKANAFAIAWLQKFGELLNTSGICGGLAVAQHETLCGDAWPGEFNWGAVQLRGLHSDEATLLSSISPDPHNVASARSLLSLAMNSGQIPKEPNGALHVDSSPGKGWYWVYFHKFASDVAGANFFIHVIADQRPMCKVVLENPTSDGYNDLWALADRMYATHYYEGFRVPTQMYPDSDGTQVTGAQMNVFDYAKSLSAIAPVIKASLATWKPFDVSTTIGQQAALTLIAKKTGHPEFDPQGIDGIAGAHTLAALDAFGKFTSGASLRSELDKAIAG